MLFNILHLNTLNEDSIVVSLELYRFASSSGDHVPKHVKEKPVLLVF